MIPDSVTRALTTDFLRVGKQASKIESWEQCLSIIETELNKSVNQVLAYDVSTDFRLSKTLSPPASTIYETKVARRRYARTKSASPICETKYHSPKEGVIEVLEESNAVERPGVTHQPSVYFRIIRPHKGTVTFLKNRHHRSHPQYEYPVKMTVATGCSDQQVESLTFSGSSREVPTCSPLQVQSMASQDMSITDAKIYQEMITYSEESGINPFYKAKQPKIEKADERVPEGLNREEDFTRPLSPEELDEIRQEAQREEEPESPRFRQREESRRSSEIKYLQTISEESSMQHSGMHDPATAHKQRDEEEEKPMIVDFDDSFHTVDHLTAQDMPMLDIERKVLKKFDSELSVGGPQCSFISPRQTDIISHQGRHFRGFTGMTKDSEAIAKLFSNADKVAVVQKRLDDFSINDKAVFDWSCFDLGIYTAEGKLKGKLEGEKVSQEFIDKHRAMMVNRKSRANPDSELVLWMKGPQSLAIVNCTTLTFNSIPDFWGRPKSSGMGLYTIAGYDFFKLAGLGYFEDRYSLHVACYNTASSEWNYLERTIGALMVKGTLL